MDDEHPDAPAGPGGVPFAAPDHRVEPVAPEGWVPAAAPLAAAAPADPFLTPSQAGPAPAWQQPLGAPPPMYPPPPQPLRALAWSTVALLVATMVGDLASLLNDVRLPGLFYRVRQDGLSRAVEDSLERWDQLNAGIATLQLVALVATGVVFICWLWRARANVDSYGWTRQRRNSIWGVLGWIVPVVNLWFPFQVVSDVWKASHPARAADQREIGALRVAPLLGLWWAAWLISNLLGRVVAAQLKSQEADADALLGTVRIDEVSSVVDLTAAVLAVLVVLQITTFQRIRAAAPVPWAVPRELVPARPQLRQLGRHSDGAPPAVNRGRTHLGS